MSDLNNNNQLNKEELFDLRNELDKFVRHWKWFVLAVFLSVFVGFMYLRYTTPQYKVSSSLLIKDEESSLSSELSAFQDFGMFGGNQSNILNEIQILKSRSLSLTVIKDLKLNVSFHKQGKVKETEIYKSSVPFELEFIDQEDIRSKLDTSFYIINNVEGNLELLSQNQEYINTIGFGEEFYLGSFKLVLNKNKYFNSNSDFEQIRIRIKPYDKIVGPFVKSITVSQFDDQSSVLVLSMQHAIPEKAKDILNTLVINYNKDGISDKNEVGERTAEFINERLKIIENDLEIVDKKAESYKKDNNLTNVESQSALFVEKVSKNEAALFDTSTQLHLVKFMNDYIYEYKDSYELLPANLGFQDVSLARLIGQYNELILERSKMLLGSSTENPIVRNLEKELDNFKISIQESLKNLSESLNITLRELQRQDRKFNGKIHAIPTMEREYSNIQREQGIKEALYLYLLQKKEENEITLAVTTANSKVVDVAYGSGYPFAPKKKIIILGSIVIGLIIPFVIIYLLNLLDNKIHSRKDIESILDVPVLGDIPLKNTSDHIIVSKNARTSTAEAFRLLRTNLDFMLANSKSNDGKIILLSSTVSGEGKSFISINLACTLALSGKKVALMGMDLRAPKITEYINVVDKKGITNFIMDKNLSLDEIKVTLPEHKGLDIYPSGIIPPNPAELLMHSRVEDLFTLVKQKYDYIIVDTAPVNLVSDTLLIADKSDLFIYVTRMNYLDKRLMEIPKNLHSERRIPNMAMLLNGTDYSKGYGYGAYGSYGGYGGYGGYGYGQSESKSFLSKIFKS